MRLTVWMAIGAFALLNAADPACAQAILGKNLIVNGDAEAGAGGDGSTAVTSIPGWTKTGPLDVLTYVSKFELTPASLSPINHGNNFFYGGRKAPSSSITQDVDISALASTVDTNSVVYDFSGYLGAYQDYEDTGMLTAVFKGSSGAALVTVTLPFPSAADRRDVTGIELRRQIGPVPSGARKVTVTLTFTISNSGNYDNACADNLSLILNTGAQNVFGTNLIVNPGGDIGPAEDSIFAVAQDIPGWSRVGNFSVALYGEASSFLVTDPGPADRGSNYFAGGTGEAGSTAAQDIDVSGASSAIDAGNVTYALSAWLGGYSSQEDNAVLKVNFQNWAGTTLSSATLGPVNSGDRQGMTSEVQRATNGVLPAGTRKINVNLIMTRLEGSYDDGYADSLSLVLTNTGGAPVITAAGVVNAGSYAGNGVAPGEIVTIFGTNLGPGTLVSNTVTNGTLGTSAGGTTVRFDGVAAPLLYSSGGSVSVVVPYETFGKAATSIQVQYQSGLSNTVSVPIVTASPAIFTLDASGKGPGAILNVDFTLNSANRPVARGGAVMVYGTGEGQTNPGGSNGLIAVAASPFPILPVTASVGGKPAQVLYGGAAPGLVAGAFQVNVLIPADAPSGAAIPIVITVGDKSSRADVTVAIQ